MQNILSCYYYPTTVMLVDDDQTFLNNIRLGLDDRLSYQVYSDPDVALDVVHSQRYMNSCLQNCMTGSEAIVNDHVSIKIDVNLIHQEIYHRHRFDELSVVLVDYDMPGMTGIEFCKRLANHPIKKVMVTDKADASIAIEAYNEGIIDQFIMKKSDNFFDQINFAIHSLQTAYFQDASKIIHANIIKDPNCVLANPAFDLFFKAFLNQQQYSEYYLMDASGSYLLVDFSGRTSLLIVKSSSEIRHFLRIARDNNAPENIINALSSRQKIPFFFNHEDILVSVEEWGRYLHRAMPIPGCDDYYYAVNQVPGIYNIYPEEVLSHREHLVQLQPVFS